MPCTIGLWCVLMAPSVYFRPVAPLAIAATIALFPLWIPLPLPKSVVWFPSGASKWPLAFPAPVFGPQFGSTTANCSPPSPALTLPCWLGTTFAGDQTNLCDNGATFQPSAQTQNCCSHPGSSNAPQHAYHNQADTNPNQQQPISDSNLEILEH